MKTKILFAAISCALVAISETDLKAQTTIVGNALTGTTSTTPNQYIGSSNNFDLVFKAFNVEQMRLAVSSGNLTISKPAINTQSFGKLTVNAALTQNNTADNLIGLSIDKQLNASYARRIFFVPHLLPGSYNGLPENNDCGIFWTDGSNGVTGSGNRNLTAGLVIAPFTGSNAGIRITSDGNVGIGTKLATNPNNFKLAVDGKIGCRSIRVETTAWADYVFDKAYKLKTLSELEAFVTANKHLPNVPSATEVEKDGFDMAVMDAKLLEKIEELSLYIIEQNKRIEALEQKAADRK
jgi:hypothetical protein